MAQTTRINEPVKYRFTTTESSTVYRFRKRKGHDKIRYSLYEDAGGAITGVYALEVSVPDLGVWATVPSSTFTNTETSGVFEPGSSCDIRWTCTTAGTDIYGTLGY